MVTNIGGRPTDGISGQCILGNVTDNRIDVVVDLRRFDLFLIFHSGKAKHLPASSRNEPSSERFHDYNAKMIHELKAESGMPMLSEKWFVD